MGVGNNVLIFNHRQFKIFLIIDRSTPKVVPTTFNLKLRIRIRILGLGSPPYPSQSQISEKLANLIEKVEMKTKTLIATLIRILLSCFGLLEVRERWLGF